MNEGEGLVEFRPACSKVDCEEPPLSGRYLCRRHEAEVAMAVAPGIPESRWAGGVPEAEAAKRAAELEKQYEAQAITDVARALVKDGWPEDKARAQAEMRVRAPAPRVAVGPDPDTSYDPGPGVAEVRAVYQPLPPLSPLDEFRAYLEGAHGAMKQATAKVLLDAMLTVLVRL